jgi:lipoate-protein ligase A
VSFLRSLEIYNDDVPRSASMNMAIDEVFWQVAETPRLRLYQWDHPALSFGYFGQYADVAKLADERDLVRRCTGGGIVFHGSDLTYALIIPASELGHGNSSMAIYSEVHQAIQSALRDCEIDAELVKVDCSRFALRNASPGSNNDLDRVAQRATSTGFDSGQAANPNVCFANPVVADVLVDGRKVAGAAQRRSRRGLLQQGSIQNIQLPNHFRQQFSESLCGNPTLRDIDSSVLNEARKLSEAKYATDSWLRRR